VDCHCRSSFVWKFTKVSMYLPYNTTITSPHHARNTTMLIIHNRKMKETSPHYKLGEHFHECRAQWRVCLCVCLSICLSLPLWPPDVRVEEQSQKGCFFIRVICWSVWLSARKHNSSASTDKDLIRPELCVPTAGPCGAFPWRFKDVSNNTQ